MAGLGNSEYGGAPLGIGDPADPTAVPDAKTSVCRWLDPISGDYQIATRGGQLRQSSGVLQRVLLAVKTVLGSSLCVSTLGTRFPKTQTKTFETEVAAEVRRVLRGMTDDEKVMRIDSLTVSRGGSRFAIDLEFTNFQTGAAESVSVTQ